MKLSAPKTVTWWIAVVLLVVGAVSFILPLIGSSGFLPNALEIWFMLAAGVILTLATLLKGL